MARASRGCAEFLSRFHDGLTGRRLVCGPVIHADSLAEIDGAGYGPTRPAMWGLMPILSRDFSIFTLDGFSPSVSVSMGADQAVVFTAIMTSVRSAAGAQPGHNGR